MAKNTNIPFDSAEFRKRKSELHKFHRQRVKQNFRDNGLAGFHDHNVLEMLLFYSIPRRDTNEIAHELINKFGSFSNVLDASVESLMTVDGVGLETATMLTLMPAVFGYYKGDKIRERPTITNAEEAIEYLSQFYVKMDYEKFVIVYLTGSYEIIKHTQITNFSKCEVFADLPDLVNEAYSLNARGLVISHCHCDGFPNCSEEDKFLTLRMSQLCKNFNMYVCDHIIFAPNGVQSLSQIDTVNTLLRLTFG